MGAAPSALLAPPGARDDRSPPSAAALHAAALADALTSPALGSAALLHRDGLVDYLTVLGELARSQAAEETADATTSHSLQSNSRPKAITYAGALHAAETRARTQLAAQLDSALPDGAKAELAARYGHVSEALGAGVLPGIGAGASSAPSSAALALARMQSLAATLPPPSHESLALVRRWELAAAVRALCYGERAAAAAAAADASSRRRAPRAVPRATLAAELALVRPPPSTGGGAEAVAAGKGTSAAAASPGMSVAAPLCSLGPGGLPAYGHGAAASTCLLDARTGAVTRACDPPLSCASSPPPALVDVAATLRALPLSTLPAAALQAALADVRATIAAAATATGDTTGGTTGTGDLFTAWAALGDDPALAPSSSSQPAPAAPMAAVLPFPIVHPRRCFASVTTSGASAGAPSAGGGGSAAAAASSPAAAAAASAAVLAHASYRPDGLRGSPGAPVAAGVALAAALQAAAPHASLSATPPAAVALCSHLATALGYGTASDVPWLHTAPPAARLGPHGTSVVTGSSGAGGSDGPAGSLRPLPSTATGADTSDALLASFTDATTAPTASLAPPVPPSDAPPVAALPAASAVATLTSWSHAWRADRGVAGGAAGSGDAASAAAASAVRTSATLLPTPPVVWGIVFPARHTVRLSGIRIYWAGAAPAEVAVELTSDTALPDPLAVAVSHPSSEPASEATPSPPSSASFLLQSQSAAASPSEPRSDCETLYEQFTAGASPSALAAAATAHTFICAPQVDATGSGMVAHASGGAAPTTAATATTAATTAGAPPAGTLPSITWRRVASVRLSGDEVAGPAWAEVTAAAVAGAAADGAVATGASASTASTAKSTSSSSSAPSAPPPPALAAPQLPITTSAGVVPYTYIPLPAAVGVEATSGGGGGSGGGVTGLRLLLSGVGTRSVRGQAVVGMAAVQLLGAAEEEAPAAVLAAAPTGTAKSPPPPPVSPFAAGLAPTVALQAWLLRLASKAGRAAQREGDARASSAVADGAASRRRNSAARHGLTHDLALAASLEAATAAGSLQLTLAHCEALLASAVAAAASAAATASAPSSSHGDAVVAALTAPLGPHHLRAVAAAEAAAAGGLTPAIVAAALMLASRHAVQPPLPEPTAVFDGGLSRAGEDVLLSPDGRTATSCTSGNAMAVVGRGFASGRAHWAFRLDRDVVNQECVCFGAVAPPLGADRGYTAPGAYLLRAYNGQLYGPGAAGSPKRCAHPGDVVRCEYDAGAGTLSFWVGGHAQGACFTGIPPGRLLCPAVCFYSGEKVVSLLYAESLRGGGGGAGPAPSPAASASTGDGSLLPAAGWEGLTRPSSLAALTAVTSHGVRTGAHSAGPQAAKAASVLLHQLGGAVGAVAGAAFAAHNSDGGDDDGGGGGGDVTQSWVAGLPTSAPASQARLPLPPPAPTRGGGGGGGSAAAAAVAGLRPLSVLGAVTALMWRTSQLAGAHTLSQPLPVPRHPRQGWGSQERLRPGGGGGGDLLEHPDGDDLPPLPSGSSQLGSTALAQPHALQADGPTLAALGQLLDGVLSLVAALRALQAGGATSLSLLLDGQLYPLALLLLRLVTAHCSLLEAARVSPAAAGIADPAPLLATLSSAARIDGVTSAPPLPPAHTNEAVRALATGATLFYPTPAHRAALLTRLLETVAAPQPGSGSALGDAPAPAPQPPSPPVLLLTALLRRYASLGDVQELLLPPLLPPFDPSGSAANATAQRPSPVLVSLLRALFHHVCAPRVSSPSAAPLPLLRRRVEALLQLLTVALLAAAAGEVQAAEGARRAALPLTTGASDAAPALDARLGGPGWATAATARAPTPPALSAVQLLTSLTLQHGVAALEGGAPESEPLSLTYLLPLLLTALSCQPLAGDPAVAARLLPPLVALAGRLANLASSAAPRSLGRSLRFIAEPTTPPQVDTRLVFPAPPVPASPVREWVAHFGRLRGAVSVAGVHVTLAAAFYRDAGTSFPGGDDGCDAAGVGVLLLPPAAAAARGVAAGQADGRTPDFAIGSAPLVLPVHVRLAAVGLQSNGAASKPVEGGAVPTRFRLALIGHRGGLAPGAVGAYSHRGDVFSPTAPASPTSPHANAGVATVSDAAVAVLFGGDACATVSLELDLEAVAVDVDAAAASGGCSARLQPQSVADAVCDDSDDVPSLGASMPRPPAPYGSAVVLRPTRLRPYLPTLFSPGDGGAVTGSAARCGGLLAEAVPPPPFAGTDGRCHNPAADVAALLHLMGVPAGELAPVGAALAVAGAPGAGLGNPGALAARLAAAAVPAHLAWAPRLLSLLAHTVGRLAGSLTCGPHESYEEAELSPYLGSRLLAGGVDDAGDAPPCAGLRLSTWRPGGSFDDLARDVTDFDAASASPAVDAPASPDVSASSLSSPSSAARLRALATPTPPSPAGAALLAWLQRFTPEPPIRRRLGAFPDVELPLLAALALHCGQADELLAAADALIPTEATTETVDSAALPPPPLPPADPSPPLLAVWRETLIMRAFLRAEKRTMAQAAAAAASSDEAAADSADGDAATAAVAAATAAGVGALPPVRRIAPSVPATFPELTASMRSRALFLLSVAPPPTLALPHDGASPLSGDVTAGGHPLMRTASQLSTLDSTFGDADERDLLAMGALQARWGALLPPSARMPTLGGGGGGAAAPGGLLPLGRATSGLIEDPDFTLLQPLPHSGHSFGHGGASVGGLLPSAPPHTALSLLHQPGMLAVHGHSRLGPPPPLPSLLSSRQSSTGGFYPLLLPTLSGGLLQGDHSAGLGGGGGGGGYPLGRQVSWARADSTLSGIALSAPPTPGAGGTTPPASPGLRGGAGGDAELASPSLGGAVVPDPDEEDAVVSPLGASAPLAKAVRSFVKLGLGAHPALLGRLLAWRGVRAAARAYGLAAVGDLARLLLASGARPASGAAALQWVRGSLRGRSERADDAARTAAARAATGGKTAKVGSSDGGDDASRSQLPPSLLQLLRSVSPLAGLEGAPTAAVAAVGVAHARLTAVLSRLLSDAVAVRDVRSASSALWLLSAVPPADASALAHTTHHSDAHAEALLRCGLLPALAKLTFLPASVLSAADDGPPPYHAVAAAADELALALPQLVMDETAGGPCGYAGPFAARGVLAAVGDTTAYPWRPWRLHSVLAGLVDGSCSKADVIAHMLAVPRGLFRTAHAAADAAASAATAVAADAMQPADALLSPAAAAGDATPQPVSAPSVLPLPLTPARWLADRGLLLPVDDGDYLSAAAISRAGAHVSVSRLGWLYAAFTEPLAQPLSRAAHLSLEPSDVASFAAADEPDAVLDVPGHALPLDVHALRANALRMLLAGWGGALLAESDDAGSGEGGDGGGRASNSSSFGHVAAAAVNGHLPRTLLGLVRRYRAMHGDDPLSALAISAAGASSSPPTDPWLAAWADRPTLYRTTRKVARHTHALVRDTGRLERAHCDVCGRKAAAGGVASWWCPPCDFDACEECFAARAGADWWEAAPVRDLRLTEGGTALAAWARSPPPPVAVGLPPAVARPLYADPKAAAGASSGSLGRSMSESLGASSLETFAALPRFLRSQPSVSYFHYVRLPPTGVSGAPDGVSVVSFRVTRPVRVWLALPLGLLASPPGAAAGAATAAAAAGGSRTSSSGPSTPSTPGGGGGTGGGRGSSPAPSPIGGGAAAAFPPAAAATQAAPSWVTREFTRTRYCVLTSTGRRLRLWRGNRVRLPQTLLSVRGKTGAVGTEAGDLVVLRGLGARAGGATTTAFSRHFMGGGSSSGSDVPSYVPLLEDTPEGELTPADWAACDGSTGDAAVSAAVGATPGPQTDSSEASAKATVANPASGHVAPMTRLPRIPVPLRPIHLLRRLGWSALRLVVTLAVRGGMLGGSGGDLVAISASEPLPAAAGTSTAASTVAPSATPLLGGAALPAPPMTPAVGAAAPGGGGGGAPPSLDLGGSAAGPQPTAPHTTSPTAAAVGKYACRLQALSFALLLHQLRNAGSALAQADRAAASRAAAARHGHSYNQHHHNNHHPPAASSSPVSADARRLELAEVEGVAHASLSLLASLAEAPPCKPHVASPPFLAALLQLVAVGSPRIQALALRVLRAVASRLAPADVDHALRSVWSRGGRRWARPRCRAPPMHRR
jgi:hypothetical protein